MTAPHDTLSPRARRKAAAIANATGILPGPASPLLAVSGRGCRDEDAEEALCDDFIARSGDGSSVVRLSQRRASMVTRGISDRRYRIGGGIGGVAFWYEVKAADGKLTPSQHRFLLDELLCGGPAACGTLEDLQQYVTALRSTAPADRRQRAIDLGIRLVETWARKGYRRERTGRQRRGGR